jgi:hypothetical protein
VKKTRVKTHCYLCGTLQHCKRVVCSAGVSSEYVYVCRGEVRCESRMKAKGIKFVLHVVNPPLKRRRKSPAPRYSWKMKQAGKSWHCFDGTGILRGFARWSFDGWDGYVLTGLPWPDSEKSVRSNSRLLWDVRRDVVEVLGRK